MADTDTQTAAPATNPAPAKVKTVLDDMPSRVIRPTVDEARAYIVEAFQTYPDLAQYEIISPVDASRKDAEGNPAPASGLGMDDEGNLLFDSEIFPPEMHIMIAVLTQRGEGAKSSTVKCITVSPIPTVDAILADETGRKWIDKIVATELNRAAVRPLRDPKASLSDMAVLDSMPKTLTDYVTSGRGGSSTLMESFEIDWKAIKAGLGKLSKAWKLANLSKRELKNGMSSKAYAAQYYPTLEETPKGSLFVFALQAFELEAKKAGRDSTWFATALASRDEAVIEDTDEDDEEAELSLDALMGAMAAPAATEAEAPAPTEEASAPEAEATA